MKQFKSAVCAALTMLFLSGCTGKEPNDISYIVALGIDSGENGKYKITVQYANPAEISGGEEVKAEQSGLQNLTVDAEDIYDAVGLADLHDSKSIFLSHTKVIVFSREVAEEGIDTMSELFINSEELRPDIYLAVSENAGEYLENINPKTEVNPAKYYKLFFDKSKLTGLPNGTQKNFFSGIETGDYDTLLPVVMSEPEHFESAVFHGGKMTGVLNEQETGFYKFLDKDFAGGYMTLQNDTTLKEPVTVKISQNNMPKYSIDPNKKTVSVYLKLEGDIYSASPEYDIENNPEEFRKSCEEYLEQECERLIKKVETEYKSDIFRLKEYSKINFLTYQEYENYKNTVDFSKYKVTVNVDFDVRTRGLVQRTN